MTAEEKRRRVREELDFIIAVQVLRVNRLKKKRTEPGTLATKVERQRKFTVASDLLRALRSTQFEIEDAANK